LDGEQPGILYEREKIIDYVPIGFGQAISVTPMQMISAENAVINGGILYEPMFVKSHVDNSGEILKVNSPIQKRSVITEQTSAIMRGILTESGAHTAGLTEYKDLKIGGKTGTAQKIVNGAYSNTQSVASFYGFAPYDDPQLSILVVVDEPNGNLTTGSMVAAPVAGKIFAEALEYINVKANAPVASSGAFLVPDVRGKRRAEAELILGSLGADFAFSGDEDGVVTAQSVVKEEYETGSTIVLQISAADADSVNVPDMKGMTVQQANNVLSALGLQLNIKGGGIAVSQSIEPNTGIAKGTKVTVEFKYIE
jgi:stage V sporulation protein D (sporulation-specific penicillin-binding protein)